VAETESGQVVGFGEYKHIFFSFHPLRYALGIEVDPLWQRQGIGGVLYDRVMSELRGAGARVTSPLVPWSSESGIRFVEKRGFVEENRSIESRLDLARFDRGIFAEAARRLEGEGMIVTSFARELQSDPLAGQKLKDLEDSGASDVPHAITDYPMGYEDYKVVILENPLIDWDGSYVAKDGDIYVGSSSVFESGIGGVVDQGFTVVRPGYRGRGIAETVKLRTALHATEKGVRQIRTYNDADNAPMLAINRKMGFVKKAEWIVFEKEI